MNSWLSGILLLCVGIGYSSADTVDLQTKLGNISGTSIDRNGQEVHRFLGIPYAKAPVGNFRFAKPKMYGKLSDEKFNASSFGSICAQLMESEPVGSEDCLFLNVFKPSSTVTKKSVMIWIHGGSFATGSSNEYLGDVIVATQDVIVVTINYRLNVFGFLTTGDSNLPGNYGLWDQRLAIQWVKDNIEDYGGDPSSVTLFGESAGGRAITFQTFSPKNDDTLFQRAITESGSALSLTYINRDPMPVTTNITTSIGCGVEVGTFLECLRSKSTNELVNSAQFTNRPFAFFPIVDDDFLPHDLGMLLANFTKDGNSSETREMMGNFANYDVFSGWNDQDGLINMPRLRAFNQRATGKNLTEGISEEILAGVLGEYPFYGEYGGDENTKKLVVDIFMNYYMNNPKPLISERRSKEDRRIEVYMSIAGDVVLILPTIQHLQLHSAVSNKNTFAYEFSHKRTLPGFWYEGPDWLRTGADHADEIAYVFGAPLMLGSKYTDEEKELSHKMMIQWTNFAKTGNPGSDYEPFGYPRNQTYTLLKVGGAFEKLTYPLNDVQRLWSAVDAAVLQHTDNVATEACQDIKGSYLSGLLMLTQKEADKALTVAVVVAVLLAVVALILLVAQIASKCKSIRTKKQ